MSAPNQSGGPEGKSVAAWAEGHEHEPSESAGRPWTWRHWALLVGGYLVITFGAGLIYAALQ